WHLPTFTPLADEAAREHFEEYRSDANALIENQGTELTFRIDLDEAAPPGGLRVFIDSDITQILNRLDLPSAVANPQIENIDLLSVRTNVDNLIMNILKTSKLELNGHSSIFCQQLECPADTLNLVLHPSGFISGQNFTLFTSCTPLASKLQVNSNDGFKIQVNEYTIKAIWEGK
ncbi:MAG: hypothetical protein AAF518_14250, partial [Spirochaetota bacterium]